MGPKKAAVEPVVAAPEKKKDELQESLVKAYLAQRQQQQSDLFEFTHGKYTDWMKYFGFNLESELTWEQGGEKYMLAGSKTVTNPKQIVAGSFRKGHQEVVLGASAANASATSPTKGAPSHTQTKNSATGASLTETGAIGGGTGTGGDTQGPKSPRESKDAVDTYRTALLADDAGVETQARKDGYAAIDEAALAIGSCPNQSLEEVASLLGAPYQRATWRQSTSQCAHHKSRAIFRWLCEHFKLLPPAPPTASGSQVANITIPIPQPEAPKPGGKAAKGGKPPAAPGAPGADGSKGKGGDASANPLSPEKKLEAAFLARQADAVTLSQIYAAMLKHIGVECEPVRGMLKGLVDNLGKPSGALHWGWNVLSLPPEISQEELEGNSPPASPTADKRTQHKFKQFDYGTSQKVSKLRVRFLVDVALGLAFIGPKAATATPGQPQAAAGGAAGGGAAKKDSQTPRGERSANATANAAAGGASTGDAATQSAVQTVFGLSQPLDYSSHFEPFYYLTDPREFGPLHYPENGEHQLLAKPIGKTHWEIYPRLTHEFYNSGIELDSHRRRSWLTIKRTPFHLSFSLKDTRHTDLCLLIFKGGATVVEEGAQPIDSKFIWTSREEVSGKVSFSIMLPDVGLYTLAVGMRRTDDTTNWGSKAQGEGQAGSSASAGAAATGASSAAAPGGGGLSSAPSFVGQAPGSNTASAAKHTAGTPLPPYRFLTIYQTLVNFIPANEPMFPKLHLPPTLCKWAGPIAHKLVMGANTITVIPTNPRVHAVAVVNKIYKVVTKPLATGLPVPVPPADASGKVPPGTPGEGSKKPKPGGAPSGPGNAAAVPKPPPGPEEPVIDRTEVQLLPLNPTKGVFEGIIPLDVGLVEFWVLVDPVGKGDQHLSSGFVSGLGDPGALFNRYPRTRYTPPVMRATGEAALNALLADPGLLGATVASISPAGETGNDTAVASSPYVSAASLASGQASASASPQALSESIGTFIPFITEIQCVKRIPQKELAVNEGEPLVKPSVIDVDEEKPFIFRLLNGTSYDGRRWDDNEAVGGFLRREPHKVGGYFLEHPHDYLNASKAKSQKKVQDEGGPSLQSFVTGDVNK